MSSSRAALVGAWLAFTAILVVWLGACVGGFVVTARLDGIARQTLAIAVFALVVVPCLHQVVMACERGFAIALVTTAVYAHYAADVPRDIAIVSAAALAWISCAHAVARLRQRRRPFECPGSERKLRNW